MGTLFNYRAFAVNDTLANKISYYHLLLLMASLPFDLFYSHLILISFAIHTLIHLYRPQIKPLFTLRTLVLQSVFWVTVISTIYTINFAGAFNQWGKHLTIFIIPIVFCLNPFDLKKYRPQLLLAFAITCTLTICYLYLDALHTIHYYHLPLRSVFWANFTNHNFSEPINIHATFFSMQIALALVYLISLLLTEQSRRNQMFYIICCCILTAGILQLSSKSVFIALLLIVNLAIPCFLLHGVKRMRFMLVSFSLSAILFVGILTSATFKERYITMLKSDLTAKTMDGADTRLARWKIAIGLIDQSPVLGYGAGSEVPLLHKYFFYNKLYNSYINQLNSHNEYISFLFKSGIWGLLIYLYTLVFGFRISLHQNDLLFFTFMVIISTVSFSEDLLDVDKGIFFYGFFFSFFNFSNERQAHRLNTASCT